MAGFGLVPLVLEMLASLEAPTGGAGEVGSVVGWSVGQVGGGVCILIMDALPRDVGGAMTRALAFQACLSVLGVPLVWAIGVRKGWWTGWRARWKDGVGSSRR